MAFVSLLQTALSKMVNFIFGKTIIFIIILGWFFVITGVLFLLYPERARKKMLRQTFGLFKYQLLLLAIYMGLFVISISLKIPGILSLAAMAVGIIIILKMFFSVKAKTYARFSKYIAEVPVKILRTYAALQIVIGALMLVFQKRIW